MDITDDHGKKIGELSFKRINSTSDLLNGLSESKRDSDVSEIMREISSKVKFPALELTTYQIYDKNNRGKKHGKKAIKLFFEYAKNNGYSHAIAQVGKTSFSGTIEENIKVYESFGWIMCQMPSPYSLRFTYRTL